MPSHPLDPAPRSTSPASGAAIAGDAAAPAGPEFEAPTSAGNPEMHLPEDFGAGMIGRLLFWIAVAFATFQIVTAFGIAINRDLFLGVTLSHIAVAGFMLWAAILVITAARGRPV